MIVSIGIDMIEIERVAQVHVARGDRFLERVFTKAERDYCLRRTLSAQSFAARFAAKEAVMKALGTGWAAGVRWVDIEVIREPKSAPTIQLHGTAAQIAQRKKITRWHLALTHTQTTSAAFVIAESI